MKKFLFGILGLIMCLGLVGCGEVNSQSGNESNGDVEETTNSSSVADDIKLYSDDTKMVFELSNIKHVFYYKGDEITAYHAYIEYADAATATTANTLLSTGDLESVDKHYVKGKYIVLEYKKSEYEDLKLSELKTIYSYMKEVKQND